MKIFKLFIFSAIFSISSLTIYAQTKSDYKEVENTITIFTKALEDGDTMRLRAMTAKDLSYGHSSGKVQDQEAFLKALSDGSSDFLKIDISEQKIDLFKNTAVVRHVLSATTNDGGQAGKASLKILLVFQKQKSNWILLTRQAVKFPPQ